MLSRARQYLEQAHVTYRHGVRHDRCLIGYPLPAPDTSRGRSSSVTQAVVDHGLEWRFLGWLGALTWVLDDARAMILRRNSQSTCHRLDGQIDPHKASSPERLSTLETARQLLQVIPEWEACFGGRFFPRFATRAGFD